jgi:hypothetical protein
LLRIGLVGRHPKLGKAVSIDDSAVENAGNNLALFHFQEFAGRFENAERPPAAIFFLNVKRQLVQRRWVTMNEVRPDPLDLPPDLLEFVRLE